MLEGTRQGERIALINAYNDGQEPPIAYTGTANDDSSEIIGRWSIAGQWSGTFIMVRRTDASAQIDVRIAETVGRPSTVPPIRRLDSLPASPRASTMTHILARHRVM